MCVTEPNSLHFWRIVLQFRGEEGLKRKQTQKKNMLII